MKSVRGMGEKEIRGKIQEMRGELGKLRVQEAKKTLRKDNGKIRPLRRDIARMLTRLNEIKRERAAEEEEGEGREE